MALQKPEPAVAVPQPCTKQELGAPLGPPVCAFSGNVDSIPLGGAPHAAGATSCLRFLGRWTPSPWGSLPVCVFSGKGDSFLPPGVPRMQACRICGIRKTKRKIAEFAKVWDTPRRLCLSWPQTKFLSVFLTCHSLPRIALETQRQRNKSRQVCFSRTNGAVWGPGGNSPDSRLCVLGHQGL